MLRAASSSASALSKRRSSSAGAGAGDQQAAEALQAFGGFRVLVIEHQHLAEIFERIVLGGFDVAALVHGEARFLEHFVERRDGLRHPSRPERHRRPGQLPRTPWLRRTRRAATSPS
jgi:hypothetical protein